MTPITRTAPPLELTEAKKVELTSLYVSNKQEQVWNQPYIRVALSQMSHNKCVYCEARIDEKSMYMEVEHFLPKSKYPDRVVEWRNLLPACKHCNGSKGDHDPNIEPILNPACHAPSEHLEMHNYRFLGTDELGRASIEVLDLNDYRNVQPRFLIGTKVMELIDQVPLALADYERDKKTAPKNRALRTVRRILKECSSSSEYSVVVATIVTENPIFESVRAQMKMCHLWTDELEQDYQQARSVACVRGSHPHRTASDLSLV